MSATEDGVESSKTIKQFCQAENLSLSSYFKMRRLGHGPRELHVPGTEIIRITPDAHREWREMLEELGQTKAADLERQRRSAQRRAAGASAAASPRHVSRQMPARTAGRRR